MVQLLWAKHREWGDDLLQAWKEWEKELSELLHITLARGYSCLELDTLNSLKDIYVFCDPSEKANRSVAYLRTEDPSG